MSTRRSSHQGIQPAALHDDDDDMDMSNSADEVMSELGDPSAIPVNAETLDVIQDLTTFLCDIKEGDEELAAGFQRLPNRRTLPDYFDVISNPVAFSTIRSKIQKKIYTSFAEFVKDVTQICHNAQVYNRPSAPIFGAAIKLRGIFTEQLKRLAAEGKIDNDEASLPDLGGLPPVEESMSQGADSEDDDDDDDDEDGDEDDDDDDDEEDYEGDSGDERRRRHGRQTSHDEEDRSKKRGRPPLVLTPVEARITAILRGLKNFKNADSVVLIEPFEKLPDRASIPDYYQTITNPIAIDSVKKNMKRKKYRSVEQAMSDIDLMFENAKTYNEDDSKLHQAAVELQTLAHMLAAEQLAKPDDDFRDEDGKLPLDEFSEGGETWHVGDWVHIRNPNDLAKPTVAQIYRIWQDREGSRWFNACWYYRPEQTVHRFDKHFYEHEVVKTSQYRDHQASEALDRCFVMFITRFNKGRPRGFPAEKQIYVCESRYNEENSQFNKIKTWASCLPDEVRDRDYEMDLYDVARPLRKIPSPIKHLLRDDAKETDSLPRPTWGSPNAPPIIGSVHRRPLEQNESSSPHSAAQLPLTEGAHSQHFPHGGQQLLGSASQHGMDPNMGLAAQYAASPMPNQFHPAHQSHQLPHIQQTPVPLPPVHQYSSPAPNRPVHIQPGNQATFVQGYPSTAPAYQQMPAGYNAGQHNQRAPQSGHHGNAYNPPRPPEVYTLPDMLNEALPESLRDGFQHDTNGRVLFFVAPPLDRPSNGLAETTKGLGHSAKYLAGRADWRNSRVEKRKARDENIRVSKRHSSNSPIPDYHPTDLQPRALDAISSWFGQMEQDTSAWKKSVGL